MTYVAAEVKDWKDYLEATELLLVQSFIERVNKYWMSARQEYTGMYAIELIPCAVTPTQAYINADPLPCTAGQPQRWDDIQV